MTSTEVAKKPKETPLSGDEIKAPAATPKKRKAGDDVTVDADAVHPTPTKKSKDNDEGTVALPVADTPKTKAVEPKTPKTASRSRGAAPAEFKKPEPKSKEAPASPSGEDAKAEKKPEPKKAASKPNAEE